MIGRFALSIRRGIERRWVRCEKSLGRIHDQIRANVTERIQQQGFVDSNFGQDCRRQGTARSGPAT